MDSNLGSIKLRTTSVEEKKKRKGKQEEKEKGEQLRKGVNANASCSCSHVLTRRPLITRDPPSKPNNTTNDTYRIIQNHHRKNSRAFLNKAKAARQAITDLD